VHQWITSNQPPAAVTLTKGQLMTRKNQAELTKAGG
jgi:L-arabinose transport system substrate-binding protein